MLSLSIKSSQDNIIVFQPLNPHTHKHTYNVQTMYVCMNATAITKYAYIVIEAMWFGFIKLKEW